MCERAYHALFMQNMLIRPTRKQLRTFGNPDYVIYNAGKFLLFLLSRFPSFPFLLCFPLCFYLFLFSSKDLSFFLTLINNVLQEVSQRTDTRRV